MDPKFLSLWGQVGVHIWLLQRHLLKGCPFSMAVLLYLCQIGWSLMCGSISGPCVLFHWFVYCFLPITNNVSPPTLICLFRTSSDYSRSFAFPSEFYYQLVNLYKKACRDFDWDCVKAIDHFEENWHSNNIESSHPWAQYVSQHWWFVPFYCWLAFHCMGVPPFVYSLISWWTFHVFSVFGNYR